jgi:hypothetical protein
MRLADRTHLSTIAVSLIAAAALAGCSAAKSLPTTTTLSPAQTLAKKATAWSGKMSPDLQQISADISNFGSVYKVGSLPLDKTTCGLLGVDATRALDDADVGAPNAALLTPLKAALEDYWTGANDCITAVIQNNWAAGGAAVAKFKAAKQAMSKATAALHAVERAGKR